jgi:uncharacterized integral membrane protein
MSVMGTWGRFSGSRTPISISRIGSGCKGDVIMIIVIIIIIIIIIIVVINEAAGPS